MAGVEIPDESLDDTNMIEEQDDEDDDHSASSIPGVVRKLDTEFQDISPPREAIDSPLPLSPTQAPPSASTSPTQVRSSSTHSASLDPRNNTNTDLAEANTP